MIEDIKIDLFDELMRDVCHATARENQEELVRVLCEFESFKKFIKENYVIIIDLNSHLKFIKCKKSQLVKKCKETKELI